MFNNFSIITLVFGLSHKLLNLLLLITVIMMINIAIQFVISLQLEENIEMGLSIMDGRLLLMRNGFIRNNSNLCNMEKWVKYSGSEVKWNFARPEIK